MFGYYICGKKDGKSFVSVDRPDMENTCPGLTEPCSNSTSPENTVCYPPEDHKTECPVTEAFFVFNDADETYYRNRGYEIESGMSPAVLVYSRETDARPITSTKVEVHPCILPEQEQTPQASVYYKLENEKQDSCSYDENTNKRFDDRYIFTGLNVT